MFHSSVWQLGKLGLYHRLFQHESKVKIINSWPFKLPLPFTTKISSLLWDRGFEFAPYPCIRFEGKIQNISYLYIPAFLAMNLIEG